jgi:hypothetical protein
MKNNILLIALAFGILAGCNGGQTGGMGASGITPSTAVGHGLAVAPHSNTPDMKPSWISESAKKSQTLFVSDYGTGDVDIFTLPTMALAAQITGIPTPQGLCSDSAGNVYVVSQPYNGPGYVYEYSHSEVLLTTIDVSASPEGCAVDPTTGNLAVTNQTTGAVAIYAAGTLSATLTCSSIAHAYFVGYHGSTLYVDGNTSSGSYGTFALCSGTAATGLQPVTISGGTIYYPGMVQWNPTTNLLVLGDQECTGQRIGSSNSVSCVYSLKMKGANKASIKKKISLQDPFSNSLCSMTQGTLLPGNRKISGGASEWECTDSEQHPNAAYVWGFPAGGAPVSSSSNSGMEWPYGAAVSQVKT